MKYSCHFWVIIIFASIAVIDLYVQEGGPIFSDDLLVLVNGVFGIWTLDRLGLCMNCLNPFAILYELALRTISYIFPEPSEE